MAQKTTANDFQVGGAHYKGSIDPWDAITAWGLGYLDGNVVKYMSRWRKKGGIQDLLKAQHYLAKTIEVVEQQKQAQQLEENAERMINPAQAAERFAPDPQPPTPPSLQAVPPAPKAAAPAPVDLDKDLQNAIDRLKSE